MKNHSKALLEIHVAVLFFGLAGLFGKLLTFSSFIITLGRVFFATLTLLIIIYFTKERVKLKSAFDYVALIFLGVVLAIHWTTFFYSIQISTVAVGLLTFSTFPVFSAFLEPLFFKEKLHFSDLVIALITLGGVALVIPSFEVGNAIMQGAFWGTISGLTFALLQVLNRKYVSSYSSRVISLYQVGVATLVLFPSLFFYSVEYSFRNLALLILLGVVFTALAHSLFIKGLHYVKVKTASVIASLEPVYGIIMAILLLHEIPSLREIVGGAVILFMALYVSTRKH